MKYQLSRRNYQAIPLLLSLAMALPACAQSPAATGPTSAPSLSSASQPVQAAATEPAGDDPAAVRILDALERSGRTYPTIRAEIDYHVEMTELGDSETRSGWVAYQRDLSSDDEKIRIHFETLRQGDGPNRRERLDYTFDGQWAAEAKHGIKQLTRFQVAPPGQKVRALQIGKGPFPPLPFGQKTQDVLSRYHAATRAAVADDPPATDYLLLTARRDKQKDLNFTRLEMWVDRKTALPARIVGYEKDKNIHTVSLRDVQGGAEFPADMFELKKGFGWTEDIRPWQQD